MARGYAVVVYLADAERIHVWCFRLNATHRAVAVDPNPRIRALGALQMIARHRAKHHVP